MKLVVEIEFPAEEAATVIRWLQGLPSSIGVRILGRSTMSEPSALEAMTPSLGQPEAERGRGLGPTGDPAR